MDRHTKYHGKILKFLPKAATVMNLPFSPNKDKRYSGAIVPMMIPHEARIRRRSKDDDDSINNREPTSPKISCMGQIKLKNKNKNKTKSVTRSPRDHHAHRQVSSSSSGIKKLFSFNKPAGGRKSSASASSTPSGGDQSLTDRAPALSQMRRFASGRDQRMASFDWTAAQVAPVDAEYRNEGGDVIIPFSAPLGILQHGNNEIDVPLQPRKEINLWKRRTMTPPRPLDLNTMMIRAS